MSSKESLLREADALRGLARQTRRVVDIAGSDNQKKTLRRHAEDYDKNASLLESEAANAKTLPMMPATGLRKAPRES
jgi:hypothetical protein